jgi:hypothetical protein
MTGRVSHVSEPWRTVDRAHETPTRPSERSYGSHMAMSVMDVRKEDPSAQRRRERRAEARRFWGRTLAIAALAVAAIMLVVWANWMVQRYIILGDDTARGERFREALHPTGTPTERHTFVNGQCGAAAEAFYGDRIGGGYAPPNEKAFFVACSGGTLGGHGGGQGGGD